MGNRACHATRGDGLTAPRAAPRYCTDMIARYFKYMSGALGAPFCCRERGAA